MAENFEKLKKKSLVAAIIKSVVIGLSAGIAVAGVFMLSFGLCEIPFHWAFYILIGVGVAAIGGGISFLFLRPTEKKVAKKYDREFNLNEKLQTMVEFKGQEGVIIALQRQDVSERLAGLTAREFTKGKIIVLVAALLLSVLIFATGIVAPVMAQTSEPPLIEGPENPPEEEDKNKFVYDDYMKSAIDELKRNVNDSSLDTETLKAAFLAALDQLDKTLETVDDKTEAKLYVLATIQLVDEITDGANTAHKSIEWIKPFDEDFGTALENALTAYRTFSSRLRDFTFIKGLEYELSDRLISDAILEPLKGSAPDLHLEDDSDSGEPLSEYIAGLTLTLQSAEIPEDDSYYISVDNLRKDLRTVYNKVGRGYSVTGMNKEIDDAFTNCANALIPILKDQCYNRVMDVHVRYVLADIFDIKLSELPALSDAGMGSSVGSFDPDGDGDGNDGLGSGGIGDGNLVVGSDELIFDPDTGTYVKYGEVLREYHQRFMERILNGDYKYVAEYFSILFSGIENSDNN